MEEWRCGDVKVYERCVEVWRCVEVCGGVVEVWKCGVCVFVRDLQV